MFTNITVQKKNAWVCLFLIVMLKYILHEINRVKSIRMFGNSKLIYNSETNKLLDHCSYLLITTNFHEKHIRINLYVPSVHQTSLNVKYFVKEWMREVWKGYEMLAEDHFRWFKSNLSNYSASRKTNRNKLFGNICYKQKRKKASTRVLFCNESILFSFRIS